MFPTVLIILSLGVGSVISFTATAVFWFPLWRSEHSGTAHALFLTNAGLALVVIFKLAQVIGTLIEGGECDFPFSMASAMLMAAVSVFQFALMKGYFNTQQRKEK